MTSQYEMHFPFTTQQEILHWESLYLEGLSKKYQRLEPDVIQFKNIVVKEGYLPKTELLKMAEWKDRFAPSKIKCNPPERIEAVTRDAFRPGGDWQKLEKLMGEYGGLFGVGQSIASTILHLYDPEKYPIFDPHALRSIRIKKKDVEGDKKFWKEYVKLCREKSKCHGVCMRTLDRALYKFSKSGAAFALKTITDEMFFLELKRRGSDLSRLRLDENTGEIVKIG